MGKRGIWLICGCCSGGCIFPLERFHVGVLRSWGSGHRMVPRVLTRVPNRVCGSWLQSIEIVFSSIHDMMVRLLHAVLPFLMGSYCLSLHDQVRFGTGQPWYDVVVVSALGRRMKRTRQRISIAVYCAARVSCLYAVLESWWLLIHLG